MEFLLDDKYHPLVSLLTPQYGGHAGPTAWPASSEFQSAITRSALRALRVFHTARGPRVKQPRWGRACCICLAVVDSLVGHL